MAHTLHLDEDGILHAEFAGDFELQEVQAYVRDFYTYLDKTPEGKVLHILLDVSQVHKVSGAARRSMVQVLQDPDPRIGKSAMVGSTRYLRVLGSFILKAIGRDNVRFFESKDEGLAWLREGFEE